MLNMVYYSSQYLNNWVSSFICKIRTYLFLFFCYLILYILAKNSNTNICLDDEKCKHILEIQVLQFRPDVFEIFLENSISFT